MAAYSFRHFSVQTVQCFEQFSVHTFSVSGSYNFGAMLVIVPEVASTDMIAGLLGSDKSLTAEVSEPWPCTSDLQRELGCYPVLWWEL